jgi:hypothetical protein
MANTLMPIDSSLVIIDGDISPIKKGYLLIKDCLGYITFQAILREPLSEINLSHIRSGIYEIQLIIGESLISQNILIK